MTFISHKAQQKPVNNYPHISGFPHCCFPPHVTSVLFNLFPHGTSKLTHCAQPPSPTVCLNKDCLIPLPGVKNMSTHLEELFKVFMAKKGFFLGGVIFYFS